jgi:hypothetical protein
MFMIIISKCDALSVKLTLLTLIDGNMFWNIDAISLRWSPSPLKLLKTKRGWCLNWVDSMLRRFIVDRTSRTKLYSSIWKNKLHSNYFTLVHDSYQYLKEKCWAPWQSYKPEVSSIFCFTEYQKVWYIQWSSHIDKVF